MNSHAGTAVEVRWEATMLGGRNNRGVEGVRRVGVGVIPTDP